MRTGEELRRRPGDRLLPPRELMVSLALAHALTVACGASAPVEGKRGIEPKPGQATAPAPNRVSPSR